MMLRQPMQLDSFRLFAQTGATIRHFDGEPHSPAQRLRLANPKPLPWAQPTHRPKAISYDIYRVF